MRKSRFTEAQMVAIMREADKGPVYEAIMNRLRVYIDFEFLLILGSSLKKKADR